MGSFYLTKYRAGVYGVNIQTHHHRRYTLHDPETGGLYQANVEELGQLRDELNHVLEIPDPCEELTRLTAVIVEQNEQLRRLNQKVEEFMKTQESIRELVS